ncbi:uncharacterized protein B0H18DRAFT_987905 [Fomitopsis serialis]|uniref:uncharacterized protein n=1 Tax=Fomitopsis serialis TaxID=139415 RepID=UPI002007BFA1|nr:uncharacterized protein B0H18DRAFT_987905 [Neoantrodia serialis]KAH9932384.1 hypothetical protein B0H18DRAFT_987905 [Neoantrodia serialis]
MSPSTRSRRPLPVPILREIGQNSQDFLDVAKQFRRQWRHPTRMPAVIKVWKIHCVPEVNNRFIVHQRVIEYVRDIPGGDTRLLWHGTIRACKLGDDGDLSGTCSRDNCNLCGIIKVWSQALSSRRLIFCVSEVLFCRQSRPAA